MHLIDNGDSYVLEIPIAIISQAGFREDTELDCRVTEQGLWVSSVSRARYGWSKAFKSDTKDMMPNDFDKLEWDW